MNIERVRERLQHMKEALDRLATFQVDAEELKRDLPTRWKVEHGLQVAIQAMIDIGTHILTSDHQLRIDDYTQMVDRLAEVGVLGAQLARALRPLPGLRNVLVHQYLDMNYELLVDVLRNELGNLCAFVATIERQLEGSGG